MSALITEDALLGAGITSKNKHNNQAQQLSFTNTN